MPERMCIVTRQVRDEDELVRFVRSPDGVAVPDLARRLPGRGVWVSLDKAKVAEAQRKGLFARGFAAAVQSDAGLADRLGQMLRQQVISHLSLARKSGEAIAGAMKVEDALKKGKTALLFHASEAAADGARKLDRLAGSDTHITTLLASADLDLAFGRANVVHAAVTAGGLAQRLFFHVIRLSRYEGFDMEPRASEDGS